MSILIENGFKIFEVFGKKYLAIESIRIDECMNYFYENELFGLFINGKFGYELDNINFLKSHPKIRNVYIYETIIHIEGLYFLKDLEFLLLSGRKKVDFSNFRKLKQLICDWCPQLGNLEKCKELRKVTFYGFNPKDKKCSFFVKLEALTHIELIRTNIVNLQGLEYLNSLISLEISYAKISKICCLNQDIKNLRFDHCKLLENISFVENLQKLENLSFNYCRTVQSLFFVTKIRSLKKLIFLGTDVIDGNMEYTIGIPYVAFTNKRHFSHKMEDVSLLTNK